MENLNLSLEDEIIDLEWCAKHGHTPPPKRKYRIIIDREKFVVDKECMTGREILVLAGKKPPEHFQLRQKFKDGKVVTIKLDEKVCFTCPGIEKFKTLPLDQTEGLVRRDFTLVEEDIEFLEGLGLEWEAVKVPGAQWVFINKFPIPSGYNVSEATVGIRITPGYSVAQLDMVYFFPALVRADNQPIGAVSPLALDGRNFQQWSRHRTPQNPWRPGIDNLSTHIPLVEFWLEQEFIKRPNHAISA